jgi:hypothetical protein
MSGSGSRSADLLAQRATPEGYSRYSTPHKLISHLEEADFECCALERQELLTFVVAGGGFAGVETIASLNDFVREALRFYPNLREELLRVVLVYPGPVILPELGENLGAYAQRKLAMRQVEIKVNTRVTAISERGVELSDGSAIGRRTGVANIMGVNFSGFLACLCCRYDGSETSRFPRLTPGLQRPRRPNYALESVGSASTAMRARSLRAGPR